MNTQIKKATKQCRICGGKANSFNYNGLACESCKTFFRRNAFKPNVFTCFREQKCEINTYNRNFCIKCRLDRCYEIGMKKELIWRSKYEQSDLIATFANQFNLPPDLANFSSNLSPYEQALLEKLQYSNGMFPDEHSLPIVGVTQNLIEALSLPKFYIKKFIQFCKSFDAFASLSAEDQLTLLKPAYVPVLNLRFAFAYDPVRNRFPALASEEGDSVMVCDNSVLYEWNKKDMPVRFTKFFVSWKEIMENDVNMRNLISVGFLFSRRNENISNLESFRYHHYRYCRLFLRYLELKYQDPVKANKKYYAVMELLKTVQFQEETFREMLVEFELYKIDHVHRELFGLDCEQIEL